MMDREKRVALAAALIIVLIVAAMGVFLILSSGSEEKMPDWVPTITPYVDDRVGILNYDDYRDLNDFCYEVELNNSCEIAVLLVNSTAPAGISDYALKTFEKNGIGQKGKDNGVLFVFSLEDRAWTVVVGEGVSDILGGAKLTELSLTYLEPYLNEGNYSQGIKLYIFAIGLELLDKYDGEGHDDRSYPVPFIPLDWTGWLVVIIVIIGLSIITKGKFLYLIFYIISSILGGKGGGKWGGGKTGGGRIGGRF
ncbi:MAG: TPM domain-containing protein [Methanomassiliicoccales archaeon]